MGRGTGRGGEEGRERMEGKRKEGMRGTGEDMGWHRFGCVISEISCISCFSMLA